jgi:hypothetical protein
MELWRALSDERRDVDAKVARLRSSLGKRAQQRGPREAARTLTAAATPQRRRTATSDSDAAQRPRTATPLDYQLSAGPTSAAICTHHDPQSSQLPIDRFVNCRFALLPASIPKPG